MNEYENRINELEQLGQERTKKKISLETNHTEGKMQENGLIQSNSCFSNGIHSDVVG